MSASSYWKPLAVFVMVTLALYVWGIWVSRKQPARIFRIAASGVLAGAGLALAGAAWAVHQLPNANANGAQAASAATAAQYQQAVSGAIAAAALPIGIANLVLLASVAVLLVGTLRPRSGRAGRKAN